MPSDLRIKLPYNFHMTKDAKCLLEDDLRGKTLVLIVSPLIKHLLSM
jgi:hypothetical protein